MDPIDLFTAAREGDLDTLRAALAADPKRVDARDASRNTPLIHAAAAGQIEAVRLLLEAGASVKLKNEDSHNALLCAIAQGEEEIVRVLLDAGSPPDDRDHLPMDFAVRFGTPGMVRMLLERGAPADPPAETFLVDAVGRGNRETIQILLEHGADPRKGQHGAGPLHAAITTRRDDLIELFLGLGCPLKGTLHQAIYARKVRLALRLMDLGADVNAPDGMGSTPLQLAAESGSVFLLRKLVKRGAKLETKGGMLGQTALHRAVAEGEYASARALLELGAKPNVKDEFSETPLGEAASGGDVRMTALLLKRGADPNKHAKSQPSPLMSAVSEGHLEAARALLEAGANPNASLTKSAAEELFEASAGETPLHRAAAKGSLELVDLLLEHGADPTVLDAKGRSAADAAAVAGHRFALQRLQKAGAPLNVSAKASADAWLRNAVEANDTEGVRAALEAGADPNLADRQTRETPLMTAALQGNVESVRLLLESGADVHYSTPWEASALRHAVVRDHLEVVKLLLEAGADANLTYGEGSVPAEARNTVIPSNGGPLTDAAFDGSPEMLELLLSAGADPNGLGKGLAPLTAAVMGRRFAAARRLLEAGAAPSEGDADFLKLMEWEERAREPAFLALAAELEKRCSAPEPNEQLPGALFFRFTASQELPSLVGGEDASATGREWGRRYQENTLELQSAVNDLLDDLGARVREAGYHLLDGGSPLGCGPMTQFLVLVPEADPFAIMAAWGLRANDDEINTRGLIQRFRKLRKEEPWDLLGIRFDTLVIQFRKDPADPHSLAKKLRKWCSDLGETAKVAEGIRAWRRVHFWWD